MKILIASVLISVAFSTHSVVAADNDFHTLQGTKQTSADVPFVEGVVKKVNKTTGKVTLSHGPLPNGMPAMTMAFRVKEANWIENLKEGQKIRFAVDEVDGAMTVVRFELIN